MLDLDKIRVDADNFFAELIRESYLNRAGLKDEANFSAIYGKYRHLFTKQVLSEVERHKRRVIGEEEERRLKCLKEFLTRYFLGMVVKEQTDRALTMQAKEVVKVDGKAIPFRVAAVKIMNASDREERCRIFRAYGKVIDKLNIVLLERMEKLHEVSKDLGYNNYAALFKETKGIDFHELEKVMKGFITRTESIFIKKMNEELQEKIGVKLKDAETHDVTFYLRAREFDKHFRKEKAAETLRTTLANMGINLDKQKNIQLDLEERPKKSPRAFCAPIKVPDEIKLVMMPRGGCRDYTTLFHEAGHSEHHGYTNPSLPVEYRRFGDSSVTEGFAFLLGYLTIDENWVRQHTKMKEETVMRFLEFQNLVKLHALRRYGAKLSYEIKLHTNTLEGMDNIYKETLESVLKFKHPKNRYLVDVDDAFYCSQYLRAWIFEAQLKAKLKEDYGEEWFNNHEAGKFLIDLWTHGQKFNVVELAQMIGYSGLDIEPLISWLQMYLS